MRLILLTVSVFAAFATSVFADQTDTRLDSLFEELRGGDIIAADETVDRILAIWADSESDTVDLLYARARDSYDAGMHDLAAALLDHVTGLAPSFAQGFALRGAVRLAQDDADGALADFSRVLELEPRHFEVRVALASMLLANKETRAAYEMLQAALEWNPHDDAVRDRARALRRDLEGQEI